MSNPLRGLLLAVLVLGAGSACHARAGDTGNDQEALTLYFRAAITIEPDGSLSRLEWDDAGKIPAAVRARLDERVASWSFEPGTIDGRPAATDSSLRLELRAERLGDGLALRVVEASTGARLSSGFPEYPRQALRTMDEAAVLARFVAEPGGERSVHIDGYVGDAHLKDEFTEAVEAMFADLEVSYELVGGKPAPATFRMPITFCINGPDCHEDAFPEATGGASRPGTAVPVASVARLVSDVRGSSI